MIFFASPPALERVQKILGKYRLSPFSYPDVGITWSDTTKFQPDAASKYTLDQNRVFLGKGEAIFQEAREQFGNWKMFPSKWVRIYPEKPEIKEGSIVGVLARVVGGIWVLNLCRIVRSVSEEREISFSYGTLDQHAERGEEKFSVVWSDQDDAVHFEILAFSPAQPTDGKTSLPYVRHLQKKFGRDATQQMLKHKRRPLLRL